MGIDGAGLKLNQTQPGGLHAHSEIILDVSMIYDLSLFYPLIILISGLIRGFFLKGGSLKGGKDTSVVFKLLKEELLPGSITR